MGVATCVVVRRPWPESAGFLLLCNFCDTDLIARQFGLNVGQLKIFGGYLMRKLICFAMMACLGMVSQSQAGVLGFGGTTSSGDPAYNNLGWSLLLTYTANNAGPTANITAATLTLGANNYSLNTAGNADSLTVNSVAGANNDTISFGMDFLGSGGVGTNAFILSGLTLNGKTDVPAIASDANILALAAMTNTLTGGGLVLVPGPSTGLIALSGSVPVPEPGSIAILSGLAIVVGRRYLKRRRAVTA